MSPLLVVAIAVVAIGLTIRSVRRGIGDRHTLEAHHRALDTLAEMSAHQAGSRRAGAVTMRPLGRTPVAPPRGTRRPPAHGQAGRSPVRTPLASAGPDLATPQPIPPALTPPTPPTPPMPAASLVAQSLEPRPAAGRRTPAHRRRSVPPAFVGAVGALVVGALGLAVGLALIIGGRHSTGAPKPAAAARAPQAPPSTSAAAVVLTAGDSQEDRFQVNRTGTAIDLVATSACWVQIRAGSATGAVAFTGVLHQGERHPLPAGQAVWVRMGNPPGMSIQVDGTPLAFTAPASSQPFNVVFQPAA